MLLGDPAAGVLEQARTALDAGDLAAATAAVATLQGAAAQAMAAWLAAGPFPAGGQGRARRLGCVRLMRRILLVLVVGVVVVALALGAGQPPRTRQRRDRRRQLRGLRAGGGARSAAAVCLAVCGVPAARRPGSAAAQLCARRQAARRRHGGDVAITRTLLALAAGETGDARREASRARRLLGDTPATLLLAAEAGRIAGRADEAETAFRALADRSDAAFLGLRGLLRQAIEREDWAEAAALARQAEAVEPGAAWLRRERARLAVRAGEWSDALALADADAPKAALATAAAEAETDPGRALRLAKQAWQDDPSLAPATLAYATRLRAAGTGEPGAGGDPPQLGDRAAPGPGRLRAGAGQRSAAAHAGRRSG